MIGAVLYQITYSGEGINPSHSLPNASVRTLLKYSVMSYARLACAEFTLHNSLIRESLFLGSLSVV